jgi:hypothetical protein
MQKKPEDITIDDIRYLGKDEFLAWCLTSGAKVDENEIDFNKHRYLIPIYMDSGREIVWQKAAQLGATIYMLLRALWWLEQNQGRKAGLYFPTNDGVQNLSSDRLVPLIDSCPSIKALYSEVDGMNQKLNLRKIGKSSFYLYHLGGVASKDSVPLDFVSFDEVRLCNPADIDQALHRISHSPYKLKTFMSTAGLPDNDINRRYQYGSQHVWMSKCGCSDGVDLARTFPDCIVHDDSRRPGEVYVRCPNCGWEIKNPQNGRYVAHNPGASFNSYHVSQLVSLYRSPKEIWEEFMRTTNMSEFYNAALGIPYIDAANRGVSKAELESCINTDLNWMITESMKDRKDHYTAMGVDQGAAYCMVVIADVNPDGMKKRIRHVEIIEQNNPEYMVNGEQISPFARLHEIMDEFNVGLAVVDAMPNYNEAIKFAQTFPRKVYLAHYANNQKEVVQWADRTKVKQTIAKAGPMLKFKYIAHVGRFPSLSFALGEWSEGNVEIPRLEGLRQMARSEEQKGVLMPESPAQRLFNHLPRLIKQFKKSSDYEETGAGRWQWVYAGGDPHLAHAWNYCNVALERLRRRTSYSFV